MIQLNDFGQLDGDVAFPPEPEGEEDLSPLSLKKGQLYELGAHRLLCGNPEIVETFEVLLGSPSLSADFVWIDSCSQAALLHRVYEKTCLYTRPGGTLYATLPDSDILIAGRMIQESGWTLHQNLIWALNDMILDQREYHTQFQLILYASAPGMTHDWFGGPTQSNLLSFRPKPRTSLYPHSKPIEMLEYLINNSCREKGIVLDPLGGFGASLIACEKTERQCFMMEPDPALCSKIITRWEKFSGGKARLLDGPSD